MGARFETFDDELDAIRLSLYEETRGMTPNEEIAYLNAKTEPLIQRYNMRISDLKPVTPFKRGETMRMELAVQ